MDHAAVRVTAQVAVRSRDAVAGWRLSGRELMNAIHQGIQATVVVARATRGPIAPRPSRLCVGRS